jgi:hypothetical protein
MPAGQGLLPSTQCDFWLYLACQHQYLTLVGRSPIMTTYQMHDVLVNPNSDGPSNWGASLTSFCRSSIPCLFSYNPFGGKGISASIGTNFVPCASIKTALAANPNSHTHSQASTPGHTAEVRRHTSRTTSPIGESHTHGPAPLAPASASCTLLKHARRGSVTSRKFLPIGPEFRILSHTTRGTHNE